VLQALSNFLYKKFLTIRVTGPTGSCWNFWIIACKISVLFWNFGQCILVCLCYLYSMATDDMDTSGPSTEGSPPQVSPVVTSSPPSDEGLRNLVAQTIQEYCHGKLIDDHSQFQRIEAQGDHTLSLLNKHDSRLDTLECQIKVLQKHNDKDRSKSTTAAGKPERFKGKSKVIILAWLNQMKKFLIARHIPALEWVTIASTYLETNVAQHWDILALELESEDGTMISLILMRQLPRPTATEGRLETKSLAALKAVLPLFTRRVSRVAERPLLQEALTKKMVFVFNVTRKDTWLEIILMARRMQSAK
jgi:hypothetical protein